MKVRITIEAGPSSVGTTQVGVTPLRIGRLTAGNDLVLAADDVSREHCVLEQEGDRLVVLNLSGNGVRVGQVPLLKIGARLPLSGDTVVQVGPFRIRVEPLSAGTEPAMTREAAEQTLATVAALTRARDTFALKEALKDPGPAAQRIIVLEDPDAAGALGPRWGGVLELEKLEVSFGRMGDVLLDDLRVSRIHFWLRWQGEALELEDTAGSNGTWVNGQRVCGKVPVRDHDRIEVRPFTLDVTRTGRNVVLRCRGLEGAPASGRTAMSTVIANPPANPPSLPDVELITEPGVERTVAALPETPELVDGGRRRSAPRWQPTSDLRHGSILGALVITAVAAAGALVVSGLVTPAMDSWVPGPVSEVHQVVIEGCNSCHVPGARTMNEGCAQAGCHPSPLDKDGEGLPVHRTGPHFARITARRVGPDEPFTQPAGASPTCDQCHLEHRGADAQLWLPPAGRCLECHTDAHDGDHKTFAPLEVTDRSQLVCSACHLEHVPPGEAILQRPAPNVPILAGALAPVQPRSVGLLPLLAGLGSAFLAPAGFAFLHRRRERVRLRQQLEQQAVVDRARLPGPPKPAKPRIDPIACVACRKCVDVCPFDALEIVNGVATLVSPQACHGVAICAQECPTGAISMVEPGQPSPLASSVPPVTETLESTRVPGIFIAGNLSGLPLIKNAINQGTVAIEHLAKRPKAPGLEIDVAIVGAGPAGLAAAIRATELGLRYVLLEQGSVANTLQHFPRQKLVFAQPFDIPLLSRLPMLECSKEELLARWQSLIRQYGLRVREGERVTKIGSRPGGGFVVESVREAHHASAVVLAIGTFGTPRKLGVPGEELEKVLYNLSDAEQYQNRQIVVVGAGDVGLETAMALAHQPGTGVTLLVREAQITTAKKRNVEKLQGLVAKERIRVRYSTTVAEIRPAAVVLKTPEGQEVLANDFVFVCAGGVPAVALLKECGVLPP